MDKKKITVLVNKSAGCDSYVEFLKSEFEVTCIDASEKVGDAKIDLILFTGGEDVTPSYYGESKGRYTGNNEGRDNFEDGYMFSRRNMHNVPKLGICRGAQFLTVMSGGSLIQHVNGHATGNNHGLEVKYLESIDEYSITSTHHQMMYPYDLEEERYEIIATSSNFLSNTYLNGINKEKEIPRNFEECEIVFYKETNSLCIQGHPEFYNCPENTKKLCLNIIKSYLKL